MEGFLISAFVMSLGYYLKNSNNKSNDNISKNEISNSQDIYHSDKVNEINKEILEKSTENYIKSRNPDSTGVIPPLYNTYGAINNIAITKVNPVSITQEYNYSNFNNKLANKEKNISQAAMFSFDNSSFEKSVQLPFSEVTEKIDNINPLTGLSYQTDHLNMTPFFGGSVKQNIETFKTVQTLDNYTGAKSLGKSKKEVENFFDLKQENIYGAPVFTNTIDTSRFIASQFKQGEKPFSSQNVAAPIAGTIYNPTSQNFQKSVDELRTGSNPKLTYEGRLKEGQKGSTRGLLGIVNKNTPDMSYEKTKDMLFTGPGAAVGPTLQQNFNFKDTNRQDISEYFGNVASQNESGYQIPTFQETTKTILDTDTQLNLKGIDMYGDNTHILMNSFYINEQERNSTSNHLDYQKITGTTHHALYNTNEPKDTKRQDYIDKHDNSINLQSIIKMSTNKFGDIPKETLKEVNLITDHKGILKGNDYATQRDKYDNVEILTNKESLLSQKNNQMGGSGLGNITMDTSNIGTIDKWKRNIYQNCDINRTNLIKQTNNVIISKKNIGIVNLETKKTLVKSR